MTNRKFLSTLALCASFFALGVIALGAFTRLIDAGLGCPDWPGCYGHLMAPISESAQQSLANEYPGSHFVAYKAWAEMVHRYFVGGLSLFILGIVISIFIKKSYRVISNVIFAIVLVLLLIYQIMLGQWTVTLKLLPIIVTQHLLGGFCILSTLWLIYLNNRIENQWRPKQDNLSRLIPWALIGFILLLLQISLGAWTSTNYASLSCPDFPFCDNNAPGMLWNFKQAFNLISPVGINYEGGVLSQAVRQTIQITHRLGALIVILYMFILTGFALPRLKKFPELLTSLYSILGLLLVQLCIGMINVIFKLPLLSAILHNLIAVLLLLAVITFIFKLLICRNKGVES